MKLSIIIPAYNEKKTILKVLKKVEGVRLSGIKKEIIVVDDFSADGTGELLKRSGKKYKVFYHKKNMGKGSAIRTGLKHATGDIVIIQDADLEYDPNDYQKIIKPILDGRTEVVYGSRLLNRYKVKYKLYYFGNMLLSFMTRIIYFTNITDMETCYKAFKKETLNGINLKAKRFDFEPEITAKIIKKGHKIIEVPIKYRGRDFKEGKKIRLTDGVLAIWYLLKYRFVD